MINSIDSMSSTMSMMRSGPMERRQPPPDKDVFQVADTNGDGLVSGSELETLAEGIEEITGTTIDLDEALSSFDTDQDGALSGEELKGLMDSLGFAPPAMFGNATGETVGMEPLQPSYEQALSAYAQNTGDDRIEQLMEFLKAQNGDDGEVSLIDITS